jgi:DNA repair exonuclease SbcCD ATPase subunit
MENYITVALPRQQELADLLLKASEGQVDPTVPIAYSQEWLSRILTAQEEIRRGIRLLELGGDELLLQQQAAEDKQFEATQFMRWLEGDLGAIGWHSRRLDELAGRRADDVAKVASETAEAEQQRQAVESAQARLAELEQGYAEARKGKDRQQIDQARRDLDQAKRDLREFQNRLNTAERNRKAAEERITRADEDTRRAQTELQKAMTNRDNHILAGGNVQMAACEQQKAVVEIVRQLWADETMPPGGE